MAEKDGADDIDLVRQIRDQCSRAFNSLLQCEPTIVELINLRGTGVPKNVDLEALKVEIETLEQQLKEAKKEFKKLTEMNQMMKNDLAIRESDILKIEESIASMENIFLRFTNFSNSVELMSEIKKFVQDESGDPNAEMPQQIRDLMEQMREIDKEEERAKQKLIGLRTKGGTLSSLKPSSSITKKDSADGMKEQKLTDEELRCVDLLMSLSNPSTSKKDDIGNIEEQQQETDGGKGKKTDDQ